jgi:hypothetical protein
MGIISYSFEIMVSKLAKKNMTSKFLFISQQHFNKEKNINLKGKRRNMKRGSTSKAETMPISQRE